MSDSQWQEPREPEEGIVEVEGRPNPAVDGNYTRRDVLLNNPFYRWLADTLKLHFRRTRGSLRWNWS